MSRFSQVPGAAHFRQFSAGLTLIPLLLGAAACATDGNDAHPAIETRTITVYRPVAVACVKASDIPAEPEKVAGKLTGDARRDLDTVSASALRLRSWGKQLTALLSGCVMP